MKNFDKERMNQNINEAYTDQTEKVKELLQTAKQNLAVNKPVYDYTGSKAQFNKFRDVSRVISKKKETENLIQNKLDSNFEKMQEKLNINSKNLDIIFENVAKNNDTEIKLMKEVKEQTEKLQEELTKKTEERQVNIRPELIRAENIIHKEIKNSQNVLEQKISNTQNILEQKINNIKVPEATATISNEMLTQIRQELAQIYQNENRYLIDSFMEEKSAYMKLIEEKDREIRNLNDRVYKCEEKLQKEIEKRHKASIFASFFKKEEEPEPEPAYTSQILSYLY